MKKKIQMTAIIIDCIIIAFMLVNAFTAKSMNIDSFLRFAIVVVSGIWVAVQIFVKEQ